MQELTKIMQTMKKIRMQLYSFAELVMFLEEARYEENIAPVFKLADLVKLYESRLKQLQIETDEKVHSTRLKERLLKHLPDLRTHNKGRDVFLVFQNDIGATWTCSKNCSERSV